MAQPYLAQLEDLVVRLWTADQPSLECRHFFAGAALYSAGKICASLTPVGLAVKLSAATRETIISDGLGGPLRYFDGGKVKKEYVLLTQATAADLPVIRKLFEESFSYVDG